jgi:hypothetical protein
MGCLLLGLIERLVPISLVQVHYLHPWSRKAKLKVVVGIVLDHGSAAW